MRRVQIFYLLLHLLSFPDARVVIKENKIFQHFLQLEFLTTDEDEDIGQLKLKTQTVKRNLNLSVSLFAHKLIFSTSDKPSHKTVSPPASTQIHIIILYPRTTS